MSRVLVTGGAGFIGSHVVERLRAQGEEVRVLDRLDGASAARASRLVRVGAHLIRGDVGDPRVLERALAGVERVVHLAARAGVRESFADPDAYQRDNVDATRSLVDALAARGGGRLVFTSSSSVYGGGTARAPRPPASPYAASKSAAEAVVERSSLRIAATTLRLFTVYGPRQRSGMAVARFAAQARAGQPLTVHGDGTMARDYTFVDDVVDAVIRALESAEGRGCLDVGAGEPVSLLELVAAIGEAVGRSIRVVHLPVPRGDVHRTQADPVPIAAALGWRARVGLPEGLARYCAWLADAAASAAIG